MKKLKLTDATKDELLEYFFAPICEGRYYLQSDKERFLIWLKHKRQKEIIDAQEVTLEVASKELKEFTNIYKQVMETKDIDTQLELIKKADRAYKRYEQANTKYINLGNKLKNDFDL